MKKNSVNTFTEGLVCDLDPINVPNNVLTDCLNGTIITYDGNEYSLQNDKGNYPLKDCKLRENFIPVGIKEYGGILYIVSKNPFTGEEEIGSYPSPKLYNGGTVDGEIELDYVIPRVFEEKESELIDYSDLEEGCRSVYYSNPNLKINVGDVFQFESEKDSGKLESIEKYIVDENSIEHLILDSWRNKHNKFVAPVSGTIMLKNKIFEFSNSSIETNTFTCWKNSNNSENIVPQTKATDNLDVNDDPDYEITTKSDPLSVLFSFTYKLYVDDYETLKWFENDPSIIHYRVNLKVNGKLKHDSIYSYLSNSTTPYDQFSIQPNIGTDIEWYQNNKIFIKHFNVVINDLVSSDVLSVEVTPIIKYADNQYIEISNLFKSLSDSISEYNSSEWKIGQTRYRYYNLESDLYTIQYIDLDIQGPVEASNEVVLRCEIKDENSNILLSYDDSSAGIGTNLLKIPYNSNFKKEDLYYATYSVIIAGSVLKSETYRIITTELLADDKWLQYSNYDWEISNDTLLTEYLSRVTLQDASCTEISKSDLPKSLYSYKTGKPDYFNREVFPNFITDSAYLTYNESRLNGKVYNCVINTNKPNYLQGNLWGTPAISCNIQNDLLDSQSFTDQITVNIPICHQKAVTINKVKNQNVGKFKSIEPIPFTEKLLHIGFYIEDCGKCSIKTVETYPTIYNEFTITPSSGTYSDLVPVKELILPDDSITKLRIKMDHYNFSYPHNWCNAIYDISAIAKDDTIYACPHELRADKWARIPSSSDSETFVKIDADIDEKYESGTWCECILKSQKKINNASLNTTLEWNTKLGLGTKNFSQEFNFDLESDTTDELAYIHNRCEVDMTNYSELIKVCNPKEGDYVKGVTRVSDKKYITTLSKNFRNSNKIIGSKTCDTTSEPVVCRWTAQGTTSDFAPYAAIYKSLTLYGYYDE